MLYKKPIILLCALMLSVALLCGCVPQQQPTERLVVGYYDYEPYTYIDEDGDPAGMDVELATEACRRIGYQIAFRKISRNDTYTLLQNGSVDCVWSCFAMDGQEDSYDWVGPYMRSRQVVAVLADSEIQTIADLQNANVAVLLGSKAEELFLKRTEEAIPQANRVYSHNQPDEIATALRNNFVDAVAGYAATIRRVLQNDGIQFRFLQEDLSHASFGVAFAKGQNTQVRNALQGAVKEMLADGTVAKVLESYGVDIDKALRGLTYE